MDKESKIRSKQAQNIWKNVVKARKCMYASCSNPPINSHVLQKNGILSEIAINGHLRHLTGPNFFSTEPMHESKLDGINRVYTFDGFCNVHDTALFLPIENSGELDFTNQYHLSLFSYRTLCQEIYRKEIVVEYLKRCVRGKLFKDEYITDQFEALAVENQKGLVNLHFFKNEFEKAMEDRSYNPFVFSSFEIPRIDLCISVPLNIDTSNEELGKSVGWMLDNQPKYFPTSFIHIIPHNGKSYFVSGYHKDFPCSWTKILVEKMRTSKQEVFKEISDLVVLRLEFWAMSPLLYNSIPLETIKNYRNEFVKNMSAHSENLVTNVNLFSHLA